jgi:hypothetical protein
VPCVNGRGYLNKICGIPFSDPSHKNQITTLADENPPAKKSREKKYN